MTLHGPDRLGANSYVDYRSSRCRCGSPIRPHELYCSVCDRKQNPLFEGLEKVYGDDLGLTIERLTREIERKPYDYLSLFRLGNAYLLKGNYESARALYIRALEKKPDLAPARLNLGGVLACLGDEKGAIAELEEYVRLDVHSPRVERALRVICALKNIPYEDVLRETRAGIGPRTAGGKGTGFGGAGTFTGARLRGSIYSPPIIMKKRAWGAIDVFLLLVIILAVGAWYIFPAQSKDMLDTAVTAIEAPFSFRVQDGEQSQIPVAGDEEVENGDESSDQSADAGDEAGDADEEGASATENANPTAGDYFPLAAGNTWEYLYFDTRSPTGSGDRENTTVREMRVIGIERRNPDIWNVRNGDQTVYYVEKRTGLYSVRNPEAPWSFSICQIPIPPTEGKSVRDGDQVVTVIGEEDVETPAGIFHCIRLHYTVTGLPGTEWTAWYAQGVGLVRYIGGGRRGPSHVLELREYHLN